MAGEIDGLSNRRWLADIQIVAGEIAASTDDARLHNDRFRTFWSRVGAAVIDGCLLAPLTMPGTILAGYGPAWAAIAWLVLVTPAVALYTIVGHGHWGKTIGKHVTGLEVVRSVDEGRAGYARAIRRDAVTLVFGVLATAFMVSAISSGDVDAFRVFDAPEVPEYEPGEVPGFRELFWNSETMGPYAEPWYLAVLALQSAWGAAEIVTMLTNRRRRALHDFIGGTVVVKTVAPLRAPAPPSEPG